jgi:hypothetical protein
MAILPAPYGLRPTKHAGRSVYDARHEIDANHAELRHVDLQW